MVCASNMNRSMEAHHVLAQAGLIVTSYGVGANVKLPGERMAGRAARGDDGDTHCCCRRPRCRRQRSPILPLSLSQV